MWLALAISARIGARAPVPGSPTATAPVLGEPACGGRVGTGPRCERLPAWTVPQRPRPAIRGRNALGASTEPARRAPLMEAALLSLEGP